MIRLTSALVVLLGLVCLCAQADRREQRDAAGNAAGDAQPAIIEQLIDQLGHPNYRTRQQASQRLDALGTLALPALTVACQHANPEVARRAADLVLTIQYRAEQQALLKPRLVHLKLHDATIPEAIAELARQSGYRVALAEDVASQLAGQTITLDTGRVSFWEAVDGLCRKADLTELVQVQPGTSETAQGLAFPGLPQPGRVIVVGGGGRAILQPPAPPLPPPGNRPEQAGPAIADSKADLVLAPGKRPELPTDYVGSVRVQAIPLGYEPPRQPGQNGSRQPIVGPGGLSLFLQLVTEPRLRLHRVNGLTIVRAVDNHGQHLDLLDQPTLPQPSQPQLPPGVIIQPGIPHQLPSNNQTPTGEIRVLLSRAEKAPQTLKELSGIALLQMRTAPAALVTVADILDEQVGRKRIVGLGGVAVQVGNVEKLETGCRVQITLELPDAILPEPAVSPRVGPLGIALTDTHGQPIRPGGIFRQQVQQVNGINTFSFELRFHYYAEAPQVPKTLSVRGSRLVSMDVPFSLRDIRID